MLPAHPPTLPPPLPRSPFLGARLLILGFFCACHWCACCVLCGQLTHALPSASNSIWQRRDLERREHLAPIIRDMQLAASRAERYELREKETHIGTITLQRYGLCGARRHFLGGGGQGRGTVVVTSGAVCLVCLVCVWCVWCVCVVCLVCVCLVSGVSCVCVSLSLLHIACRFGTHYQEMWVNGCDFMEYGEEVAETARLKEALEARKSKAQKDKQAAKRKPAAAAAAASAAAAVEVCEEAAKFPGPCCRVSLPLLSSTALNVGLWVACVCASGGGRSGPVSVSAGW
jgi:hypothetical protein